EHEQVRSRLVDHPAHRLTREWRELEVAVHVVGRLALEVLQRLLGPAEGALRVIEMVQPRDDPARALFDAPAAEVREAVEQAVKDQDAEEERWRFVDGQVILRADVLATAKVVSDRHGVVVERRVEEAAATTDMQHEGAVVP